MKIRLILISLFCFLLHHNLSSQAKNVWFPSELNVQPFTANIIEPRAGFEFLLGKSELRLNIGTSMDFLHLENDSYTFSLGADLFTYSLLRSESDFHFPVDAIDYLFGLNAAVKFNSTEKYGEMSQWMEYGLRFRLSHISAHFVDGHFDNSKNFWRNNRYPQVYSREFFELFPFINYQNLRVYTGFTFVFNVTPKFLGKEIYQAGFDYYIPNLIDEYFTPFVAYDFKLSKVQKFSGNNSFVLGLKFGHPNSKGFSLRFSYFSGKSIHGEYFDVNESYLSLGFNLEI